MIIKENVFNENKKKHLEKYGYVIFKRFIDSELTDRLRQATLNIAREEREAEDAELYDIHNKNQRVWNLLNKGQLFREIIQHQTIQKSMQFLLGEDILLSSWAANIIGQGGGVGRLHVDVPLGDFPDPLPAINLTANSIWLLDDFTEKNGATLVLPGSHKFYKKPGDADQNRPDLVQLVAPKGSLIIINGAIWHGSGANHTDEERIALLGYFCKSYIHPMEDWSRLVDKRIIEEANTALKKIMGIDYGIRKGSLRKPSTKI